MKIWGGPTPKNIILVQYHYNQNFDKFLMMGGPQPLLTHSLTFLLCYYQIGYNSSYTTLPCGPYGESVIDTGRFLFRHDIQFMRTWNSQYVFMSRWNAGFLNTGYHESENCGTCRFCYNLWFFAIIRLLIRIANVWWSCQQLGCARQKPESLLSEIVIISCNDIWHAWFARFKTKCSSASKSLFYE